MVHRLRPSSRSMTITLIHMPKYHYTPVDIYGTRDLLLFAVKQVYDLNEKTVGFVTIILFSWCNSSYPTCIWKKMDVSLCQRHNLSQGQRRSRITNITPYWMTWCLSLLTGFRYLPMLVPLLLVISSRLNISLANRSTKCQISYLRMSCSLLSKRQELFFSLIGFESALVDPIAPTPYLGRAQWRRVLFSACNALCVVCINIVHHGSTESQSLFLFQSVHTVQ